MVDALQDFYPNIFLSGILVPLGNFQGYQVFGSFLPFPSPGRNIVMNATYEIKINPKTYTSETHLK